MVPKQRRQRALAGGNPLRAGDAPRCGTPAAGADACWKIGLEHDFSVSIGKAGKYLRRFLTQADWNAFLSTYASGALAEMWAATVSMCRLFDRTAREVAQKLHYPYDEQEAENSFQYLLHVQRLPKGVSAIDDCKNRNQKFPLISIHV